MHRFQIQPHSEIGLIVCSRIGCISFHFDALRRQPRDLVAREHFRGAEIVSLAQVVIMLQRCVLELGQGLLVCVRGLPSEWRSLLRSWLGLVVLLELKPVRH